MEHRIGYACINTSIDATTNKTCRLGNCTDERLRQLIHSNLSGLKEVISWNNRHNIFLYRVSSVIIPFASHEVNKIQWWEEFKDDFEEIGKLIKNTQMRVSMHPGQYVNINSNSPEIVKSSLKELDWHAKFLDSLNLDSTHRLIFHTGGVYGDKTEAKRRFIKEYKNIPENIKARLTLENDDKSYNVQDVLNIHQKTGIPIVFDILHHQVNNTGKKIDDDLESILKLCFATWNDKTGIPKIHYSTQRPGARPGMHADSINIDEFIKFYLKFKNLDFDIMFETKNKEKSVLEVYKRLSN
ncbi:MAG: UV DNA damage repair endonuclease UvsE [Candidatus Gastranaerophilales bacterium]|nr:UV DNA damage repair endonuclease UvsE [Candidatus Gastranaerophilales bacterium]